MTKQIIINLTTARIDGIVIYPLPLRVAVKYSIFDEDAVLYKRGEITLWQTMPDDADDNPNWLQLPSKYVLGLETLAADALALIETKEL
jgi:hypothetical protein